MKAERELQLCLELDWINPFYEGVAAAGKDGKSFHIFPDGRRLYRKEFKQAGNFHAGLAWVLEEGGKYRYIDKKGRFVGGRRKFDEAGNFRQGRAKVKDKGSFFHILEDTAPLYGERYVFAEDFSEGFAPVQDFSGNFYHLSLDGVRAYAGSFDWAGPFFRTAEGLRAIVRKNGAMFRINAKGKRID